MQNDIVQLQDQIRAVSEILGLSEFVIEKDLFVTKAISVVNTVTHDIFDLIFQGGTSLAKAYGIIERMSEDCDFRMRLKMPDMVSSKEMKRIELRKFRYDLIYVLRENGFIIDDEDVCVRNEGQFMSIRARYSSIYYVPHGIKPYIALEFFLGNIKTAIEEKNIETLIQQTLDTKLKYYNSTVNCVSVVETAAEKWVALTRRIATIAHRQHYKNASLVRHLYDLYKINEGGYIDDKFGTLVSKIVLDDRSQYKKHNLNYFANPVTEIRRAITELHHSAFWLDSWNQFTKVMVFEKSPPHFQDVLSSFNALSGDAFQILEKLQFVDETIVH